MQPGDSIGDRLKTFAKKRFGSVEELARAADVNSVQLQKYVGNVSKPGADVLRRLQAVGLSIDWLLGGVGAMVIEQEGEVRREEPSEEALAEYLGRYDPATLLRAIAEQLRRSDEDKERTPSP